MPLFYSLIHHIPKECFSPLKHSTSAWASLREEDQQQDQDQDLQQVKSLQSKSAMSYINRSGLFQRLSVFKSCVALAFITRTAPATVPLHPWTFPSRECGGVLSVPENQKRVGQWWGCLLPLCPSRNASSGLWWADRGRLTWLAGFMAKRVKWPNNDRREALGHSIAHHDPTDQPHLQDASPLGRWLSPCSRSVDLMACRRPTA